MSDIIALITAEHSNLRKQVEQQHAELMARLGPAIDSGLLALPQLPSEAKVSSFSPQALEQKSPTTQCASTQTIAWVLDVLNEPATPTGKAASSEVKDKETEGSVDIQSAEKRRGHERKSFTEPATAEVVRRNQPAAVAPSDGAVGKLEKIVNSSAFEMFFVTLIFLNALVMAAYAQYTGLDTGHKIGYPGSDLNVSNSWDDTIKIFDLLELGFGCAFIWELVLKVVVYRTKFYKSPWNIIDAVIVGAWCLDMAGFSTLLNPMMLRLFRLAKLLRIAKLVRSFKFFDSLSILLGSIAASTSIAFWSSIVILCLQLGAGLFFSQMVEGFIQDKGNALEDRFKVYNYFGTFTRSYLSMYELTFGNWVPICRTLTEEVDETWILPVIIYHYVVAFVFIRVITSVFIFETAKSASTDEDILIMQKTRDSDRLHSNFKSVFTEIDDSGDGCVNWEEFQDIINDQRVVTWLAALDFDVGHCKGMFKLLDDGDGHVSFIEFIKGVQRLKGTAKSVDLITMQNELKEIRNLVHEIARPPSGPPSARPGQGSGRTRKAQLTPGTEL